MRNRLYALPLALVLALMVLSGLMQLIAQEPEENEDSLKVVLGLEQLPPDVRGRWIGLRNQVDPERYGDLLGEGELLLWQLGELRQSIGIRPPTPDMPAYSLYSSIEGRLISLLDKIQLAIVLKMPDEELEGLLDYYRSEKESLVAGARSERQRLIDEGVALLRQHENDPYFLRYPHRRAAIADLYFRLTELIYEESYDRFLDETDTYIAQLDSLSKVNPQAVQGLIPPKPDYSRVLAMYQRIVDEFPASQFADDALYNLAVLFGESEHQSDRVQANRLHETLLRVYPESDYRLNSLRRIGEFYFNPPVNDLEKSVEIYQQIATEFSDTEYLSEAWYKLGWCYYRMNEIEAAVEHFARSLDAARYDESRSAGSGGIDIATESINYIGICFAIDPRDWKGAGIGNLVAWLDTNPERRTRYGRRLIVQLGDIYHLQIGRHADAVEAYERFVAFYPLDPRTWKIARSVVEIFQSGEIYNPQRAYGEKIKFFQTFSPDSVWWAANDDPAGRNELTILLESYLDLILQETLALASQSNSPELFADYERFARQYLRFWPHGPNAYRIHYNLASSLEKSRDKRMLALREYWQVVNAYTDTSNRAVAAQRIVGIAQDLMKEEREGTIRLTAQGTIEPGVGVVADAAVDTSVALPIPTPLMNGEALLLTSFDLFVSLYPASPLVQQMLYQAGSILYDHNRFADSRLYLERLLAEFPDSKFTEDAYTLLLESRFRMNEFAEVEGIAARIKDAKVSDKLREAAGKRKAESVFLNASNLKQGEDHYAAAAEFRRVALESPDFQFADRSLFQAGLEFNLAEAWKEANEAFLLLADRYPKSEFGDKSLYNAGFNLQSNLKQPAQSAAVFERLANAFPQSDLTQGALSNASANFNQVEDHRSAIRVNELYVKLYPAAEDASVYLFENASHYLKLGEVDKANDIYRRFAERYPDDPRTVQAYFERGKYLLDKGDRAGSAKEYTATVDAHQRLVGRDLAGSPRYASQALSALLLWEQEEYAKLRLNVPEAQFAATKERKKQWRNAMVEKYQQLARLGQKEAYRAFYQMGLLDEDFARNTYALENPPGKTDQARQEALAKLIDESIILNLVAAQTYRSGYDNLTGIIQPLEQERAKRGVEFASYSEMVARLQKDESAIGVADSLSRMTSLQRALVELDSALIEAQRWSDSCRLKIPEVVFRNGDYLTRLWKSSGFNVRSTDKDEEVRMLFREEAVKNLVTPLAPEVIGQYAQALLTAREVGLAEPWRSRAEQGYAATLDTLLSQYVEQVNLAQSRLDRYIGQYETMLPRGGNAKSPQGFYPDEMGGIILDQIEYVNAFLGDLLAAYRLTLDTLASYHLPYGFGEQANNKALGYLLEKANQFQRYIEDARRRHEQYAAKYDETSEIHWDDAAVAFEDAAGNFATYEAALLEGAFQLRQDYALSGETGIEIMHRLIALNPDRYAAMAGIAAQQNAIVTDARWKIWAESVDGFQDVQFDDGEWLASVESRFPGGSAFGILDSLGARSIWFSRERPLPVTQVIEVPVETPPPAETPAPVESSSDTTGSDSIAGEATEMDMLSLEESAESDTSGGSGEDAMPEDTLASAGETPTTTPAPFTPPPPERRTIEVIPPEEEALYRLWMESDSAGVRRYWFRRTFALEEKPTSGRVWATADDNYSLFVNGTYVSEDKPDEVDWQMVDEINITDYLQVGRNVIAFEASDVDATRYGLLAGLIYEVVPDLQKQLSSVVDRARQEDLRRKSESAAWLRFAGTPKTPQATPETVAISVTPAPGEELSTPPRPAVEKPTPEQLHDFRVNIRNKLR